MLVQTTDYNIFANVFDIVETRVTNFLNIEKCAMSIILSKITHKLLTKIENGICLSVRGGVCGGVKYFY